MIITLQDSFPVVEALSTWDTVRSGVSWDVSGLHRVVSRYGDVLDMAHCTLITLVSANTFKNRIRLISYEKTPEQILEYNMHKITGTRMKY